MPRKCIDRIVASPEVEADLPEAIRAVFDHFLVQVQRLLETHPLPTSALAFLEFEQSIFRVVVKITDQIVACALVVVLASSAVDAGAREVRKAASEARGHGLRHHRTDPIPLTFLGGSKIAIPVPYYAPDYSGRRGRRRTRRGRSGNGCYPAIEHLGFVERFSPASASVISRDAAALASFREARDSLDSRGLNVSTNTVRRIAEICGERQLRARDARVDDFERGDRPDTQELAGKRVAVAFDGGRTRTRISRRRGRRRRKTRRRGYDTPWREPKLMVLYTFDAKGIKTTERPVYEGTFESWDDAFRIFTAECSRRGIAAAAEVVVLGDGSRNIWDRVDPFLNALNIDPTRVTKVLDFYHATEHLSDLVKLCRGWSKKKRERWLATAKKHLMNGKIEKILEAGERLKIGRRAPQVDKELSYFRARADLMQYGAFKKAAIPRGSGAVESAIRRVVNLRLKGPGIFWEVDNAERLLALRARYKAGRWRELEEDIFSLAAIAGVRRLLPRERTHAA